MSAFGHRVMLVDDHPVVRQGLAGLLQDEGFVVVAQTDSADRALHLLREEQIDLVVADLSLDAGSGMQVIEAAGQRAAAVKVVVYSVHGDPGHIRRALAAGAMGYVTKAEDPQSLVDCLRRVGSGERCLSTRAARAMADALAETPGAEPALVLSPQELHVYELLGTGRGTQEIAADMGLSVRTVESYYGRILLKLGLSGRSELRRHATARAVRDARS